MLGVTEDEVIRESIGNQLSLFQAGGRDLDAWNRENIFIAKRMSNGVVSGGRKFRREDSYNERLSRYGS